VGFRTSLLVCADGDVPQRLREVTTPPDPERTAAMMRRLFPGGRLDPAPGSELWRGCYAPDGGAYAGSWPGLDVVCDRRVMFDRPSQLPPELVAATAGRRTVLHASHSVVDWLAFAVWEDGRLIRSLSIAPDEGIIEDIGEPLPFEVPYWAGEFRPDPCPWAGREEEPDPLPFPPLAMGDDSLRGLFGFAVHSCPRPGDVRAEAVALHGFRLHGLRNRELLASDPEAVAASRPAVVLPPPHSYVFGPDDTLILPDDPWAQ
jgi:hypothetical protein